MPGLGRHVRLELCLYRSTGPIRTLLRFRKRDASLHFYFYVLFVGLPFRVVQWVDFVYLWAVVSFLEAALCVLWHFLLPYFALFWPLSLLLSSLQYARSLPPSFSLLTAH